MKKCVFAMLAAMLICFVGSAAPEPKVVQDAPAWTLDVTFEPVQEMAIKVGGESQRFWYQIFSVTNNTGDDVDFYPNFELMTDTLQLIPAGKDIPCVVYDKIKKRHARKYPFLESANEVDNRILEGSDNTRDIVVVWPDFDAEAKIVHLFATGFSNETAVIDHPTNKNENGEPEKAFLRKTLELTYSFEGDSSMRSSSRITYLNKNWVMR